MLNPTITTPENPPPTDATTDYVPDTAYIARLMWDDLPPAEQLELVLAERYPPNWFTSEAIAVLALYRTTSPGEWGRIKAIAWDRGVNTKDLTLAVDNFCVYVHPPVTPLQAQDNILEDPQAAAKHNRVATPTIVTMDSVTAKPIEWFWWPYLALGTLAMLDGDPGIGKTILTSQLAANTSRGWSFPNQYGTPEGTGAPAHSLFLAKEDSLIYTVRKRLDDINADVSKIHYLTGWRGADDEEHDFSLDDMDVLYQALDKYRPRFVVLDPIQSYLGPKVDMHRANETRPLLNKLTVAAEAYHCLIICVRHPAKASGQSGGKAMLRGLGSVDFIGAARTGLFIEEHPTDKTLALMAMSKSNLGPKGRTQIFSKANGVFTWAGVTRMDAEILAGSGRGPDPQAFFEAYLWLEKRLEGGIPVPATDIEDQAEHDLDISLKVLKRAKKALGVVSRKMASGTWMWNLPSLTLLEPQGIQGLQGLQGLQGPLQYLRGEHRGIPLETFSQREEVPIGQESQEDQEVLVDPVVYREETEVTPSAVDFHRNGGDSFVAYEEGDV
jgi:DNA repair protein RadA/Sms